MTTETLFTVTVFLKMMQLKKLLIACILLILFGNFFAQINELPGCAYSGTFHECQAYSMKGVKSVLNPIWMFLSFTVVYTQSITENEVHLIPKREQLNQPLYTSACAS